MVCGCCDCGERLRYGFLNDGLQCPYMVRIDGGRLRRLLYTVVYTPAKHIQGTIFTTPSEHIQEFLCPKGYSCPNI